MAYHFFTRQANVSISATDAGAMLLAFLAGRFPYHSEAQWRDLIVAGRVSNNGRAVLPDDVLSQDDCLQYLPLPVDEPAYIFSPAARPLSEAASAALLGVAPT